ncbi:MAG: 4-hydroxy-tetrahydrodipicolinate synthase, partial [Lachnospiraceae bacterium]|nr:4-hydroxy-tetrahydrodipicolinate synthase [Lachnospiraceae bacterium]
NKRIPVVEGTGSNCTETAIYLSQEAEKAGVDGLLIVTPYYNKATQKGLIKHYTDIANSVSLPIIMYNVPSRTGVNIAPETAVYLAKNVKNIVGIKEATGNISQAAKLMSLADGCLDLYSGNDDQVVPILSLGGVGVISVIANIAPQQTHDMVAKYLEGDVKTATAMQLKSIDLCDALFCEVNPIPVKKAVEILGLCKGNLRMPLTEIEPEHAAKLEKAMKDFGLEF